MVATRSYRAGFDKMALLGGSADFRELQNKIASC
jgi:hypothetical protein